jgi:hypothetical protein
VKHACQQCGQKYAIPDDRVLGKVLKVRCGKCRGVMEVDGTRPQAPSQSTLPREGVRPGEIPSWYVALAGKPYGPYTRGQVVDLVEFGEIRIRTLMWQRGMGGWERVGESHNLRWVRDAVWAREATVGETAFRTPTQVFDAVPVALVSDGRAYFPNPTLHTGFTVLSEEARAYLESVARREERAAHGWRVPLAAAMAGGVAMLSVVNALFMAVMGGW